MTRKIMSDELWTTIYGQVPSKSNCYRIITLGGHGSLAKSPALKAYEQNFYMQIGALRNRNIEGFFEFYARVYYPNNRSDIDNSAKIILDCLQKANVIKNDNKCVKLVLEKFIDKDKPRVEIFIKEIE